MRIVIIGASGFVGSRLTRELLESGHRVTGVARSQPKTATAHPDHRFIAADTTRPGEWMQALAEADAVVNLAGRPIFQRWTDATKQAIRDSRILTTRNVVDGLSAARSATLISASGVGFYGDRGDQLITENEPAGTDFLARLAVDWEGEAQRAAERGWRVVLMRLGVVLGRGGGAMAQMVPAFKACVGGPLGSGKQWFAWIHLDDLAAAVRFLLEQPGLSGPINMCSPNPVRNRGLADALGRALNRPAFMPAPAFVIRLVLGEFANVLLGSQRAVPEKLLQHRFVFQHPDILPAVQALVQTGRAAA